MSSTDRKSMDGFPDRCLKDLDAALEWLELLRRQERPFYEIKECRSSLLAVRAHLATKTEEKTPLKSLNLPTGVYNSLMRAGCQTVESISCLTSEQLLAIPRVGTGYADEILKALKSWHREQRIPSPLDSHSES